MTNLKQVKTVKKERKEKVELEREKKERKMRRATVSAAATNLPVEGHDARTKYSCKIRETEKEKRTE